MKMKGKYNVYVTIVNMENYCATYFFLKEIIIFFYNNEKKSFFLQIFQSLHKVLFQK